MRFKSLVVSIVLLAAGYSSSTAQKYPFWEAGIFLGFSNYTGELSTGFNDFDSWKNAGGILGKLHLDPNMKLRAGLNVGRIMGDDAISEYYWRRNRNLNFRSDIYEFYIAPEIHFFTSSTFNRGIHPYVYGGLAIFQHNPQGRYENAWIDLQPLGTEGQETNYLSHRSKYSLTQVGLPFGFGMEFDLGNFIFLSVEFGYRWTLTDFLDDISGYYPDINEMEIAYGENSINQLMADRRVEREEYSGIDGFDRFQFRGDPTDKDRYAFFGINLTKKFTGILCNTY